MAVGKEIGGELEIGVGSYKFIEYIVGSSPRMP